MTISLIVISLVCWDRARSVVGPHSRSRDEFCSRRRDRGRYCARR